ncbi:MAG: hypothetical protein LAO09_18705 [Acidobacteriia bacterium]|nr:hypothetical protein [Terriglobia bacterium]
MVATALESYMDESGIQDGAHACVVAGYWGSEKQWRKFEPRWRKIIRDADEPTLKEFHSNSFWRSDSTRKGVFAKWSNDKAEHFINDLLACIGDYRLYPAGFALDVSAWDKLNKNERMFLTGGRYDGKNERWVTPSAPNQTYYLPFQFCVVAPASTCKPHLKVHYFFDLNKQFKNHATDLFKHLKKDETVQCRDRMGELALPTSEAAPGLQAADLLAYQSYQFCKIRIARSEPIRMGELNPILQAALKNMRDDGDFRLFDEKGIRTEALKNLPSNLRSDQTNVACAAKYQ